MSRSSHFFRLNFILLKEKDEGGQGWKKKNIPAIYRLLSCKHHGTYITCITSFDLHNDHSLIIISILNMRKMRLREFKQLAQDQRCKMEKDTSVHCLGRAGAVPSILEHPLEI